ncbi:MAG: MAPEG family protein [Filomicrobium sp.]
MPITTLYALPLALIFITLTFRTIGYRRANRISLGDAGDKAMLKRMRVHANCAEYTPMGLIVLGLTESLNAPALALHIIGCALVLGRFLHAYGMSQTPQVLQMRVYGMILTINAIGLGLLYACWLSVQRLLA